MQLSFSGKKFLQDREGFRDTAYQDEGKVWTIGFGTIKVNGKPVLAGQKCTRAEAELWFDADTIWAQTAVNKLVKAQLTQKMFDALVSFVYNVGENAFATSTLLRLLNQGRPDLAAKEFIKWKLVKGKESKGLLARRVLESRLFEEGLYERQK